MKVRDLYSENSKVTLYNIGHTIRKKTIIIPEEHGLTIDDFLDCTVWDHTKYPPSDILIITIIDFITAEDMVLTFDEFKEAAFDTIDELITIYTGEFENGKSRFLTLNRCDEDNVEDMIETLYFVKNKIYNLKESEYDSKKYYYNVGAWVEKLLHGRYFETPNIVARNLRDLLAFKIDLIGLKHAAERVKKERNKE